MRLEDYFETATGIGVLSTADDKGRVNAAIYGRPHFMDKKTIAFIASDRLTRANLKKNPFATYLFKEEKSYKGHRLYLTKTKEDKDSPLIDQLRRKKHGATKRRYENESKFLIYFRVNKVLPLIGDGK
ncbi:MAG TPA: pyridoxamine 5'-phosphate oxidase family protein [Smithella sp.]|nr:pyridoxamine 5'-phosphate oxidase family protein [Smithella sp.]